MASLSSCGLRVPASHCILAASGTSARAAFEAPSKLAERSATHLPLSNSPEAVLIHHVFAVGKLAVLRLQVSFLRSPLNLAAEGGIDLRQVHLWGEWWWCSGHGADARNAKDTGQSMRSGCCGAGGPGHT